MFGRGSSKSAMANAKKAERSARDGDGDARLTILHTNLAHVRAIAEAEESSIEPLLETLAHVPVARVPQRPVDVHDLTAISEIGTTILGR